MLLISSNGYGQSQTPRSLDFMRNPHEYRAIQESVHKELSKKILEDAKQRNLGMSEKTAILEFLYKNRPDVIKYDIDFSQEKEAEDSDKKVIKPKEIYFIWGYNRAWHSNSDMIFTTDQGNFKVHNASGVDRPTPFDAAVYFNPVKLSIPQYVVKIGYMFNENMGIELSQDHMKWVFVNDKQYEFTGEYQPTVYVEEEGQHSPVAQSFDEIKESGNATWLGAEHSDGYNYVNVSAVFNLNILTTKKEIFKIDFRPNVGAGLMIPKTKVMMHKNQIWNWEGLDNKFHVAGYGAHVETKLRFTFFRRFFIEAAARATYIKIDNALVDGSNARLEQSPIGSLQAYGAFGFSIPLNGKKKGKKKKPFDL